MTLNITKYFSNVIISDTEIEYDGLIFEAQNVSQIYIRMIKCFLVQSEWIIAIRMRYLHFCVTLKFSWFSFLNECIIDIYG